MSDHTIVIILVVIWFKNYNFQEITFVWIFLVVVFNDLDNYDSVFKPDILECEVKWALGSITTNKGSGGDGIPVELFQILKDDAVKVLHSICQQTGKTQQWPQDWKRSVFIPIPKKGNAKECSNYCTIALSPVQFSRSVVSDSL